MSPSTKRLSAAGLAGVVLAAGATVPAIAAPAADQAHDTTRTAEQARVDQVPTPRLDWYSCYQYAQCTTVRLPLDYDKPHGATTEIAVLRVKAKDQAHKIGSLFVNPGGPGGSGTEFALAASTFLSDPLLQHFDIVGVDPRGIASSENVKCFGSVANQARAYEGLGVPFPTGKAQEAAYIKSSQAVGRACSTTGHALAGAMSTAEVVRDMDVIRRAVGDRKLTYLGFSYGTALGQYYANMFPDRFRALVVDGVIDPVAWTGIRAPGDILDQRLHSANGAYRALQELLVRCQKAGKKYCMFAAGNPVKRFDAIAQLLKSHPLVITNGNVTTTITYADFIAGILGDLYGVNAGDFVTQDSAYIEALQKKPTDTAAKTALLKRIADARRHAKGYDFPYDNGLEAFSGVVCTDGLHPADAHLWPAATAREDQQARYFGRAWGWSTSQCARDTWTVRDSGAYRGPFDRRTEAPVLLVGAYWDPATNYDSAVSSSERLPNSRLLSSTNWGHTSYGTSPCVTGAIDTYLLSGALPARGKVCRDAYQPFTQPLPTSGTPQIVISLRPDGKRLPPVVDHVPPSVLNGTR